jgi:hypothetical protein
VAASFAVLAVWPVNRSTFVLSAGAADDLSRLPGVHLPKNVYTGSAPRRHIRKNVHAWVSAGGCWVAIDASSLGVRRGSLGGGPFDMGVVAWFLVCLLLWIVGFPAYLATRSRYAEQKRRAVTMPISPYAAHPFMRSQPTQPYAGSAPQWQAPQAPQQPGPDNRWASGGSTPSATAPLVDELARLAALRDSGALSQDEFEMLKARRLDSQEP